jgi:serine/threonine protein phosphatase 1
MELATKLNYPVIAIGDLHGQRAELERLIKRLETLPEWPDCSVVFLGDYMDKGPDVRGTIDLVL